MSKLVTTNPFVALLSVLVYLTVFIWLVYFWYRVAVTVHAWPFG